MRAAVRRDAVRARRGHVRRVRRRSSPSGAASSRSASRAATSRARACSCGVTPLGELELLSTHDQLLGGDERADVPRLRVPREPRVRAARSPREAAKIGARLAAEGVIGRFALDFVAVRERRRRVGDRTRSRSTCARAAPRTRSSRCSSSPTAPTTPRPPPSPRRRASRSSSSPATTWSRRRTAGSRPTTCSTSSVRHGLHFDQSRQTGVVFHMMAALTEAGHLGLTAVGDSPEEARTLYDRRDRGARRRRRRRGRAVRLGVTTTVLTRAEEVGCRD